MLWTTLIRRVDAFVQQNPEHDGSEYILREAKEKSKSTLDFLSDLDVRKVGSLREHVREAFPEPLRSGMLYVIQNGRGEWVVEKMKDSIKMCRTLAVDPFMLKRYRG